MLTFLGACGKKSWLSKATTTSLVAFASAHRSARSVARRVVRGEGGRGAHLRVMGRKRCRHGKRKSDCADCNPCPHGKVKHGCTDCNPCPHGKLKHGCTDCNPCPHDKLKHGCTDCNPCPHGKLKSKCAACNPCPHGKRKCHCTACVGVNTAR